MSPCLRKRLKLTHFIADAHVMFLPSTVSPPEVEAALQAFCAAMNTPVVNIDELDVAPARAAILLCSDENTNLDLLVCVRSITSGDSVIFKFQGDPAEFGTPAHAIEVAMSFAEGIGFIFDEELIERGGAAGRRRAWKIWMSLIEDIGAESVSEEDAAPEPEPEPEPEVEVEQAIPELSLTDRIDDAEDDSMGWVLEDEISLDEAVCESDGVLNDVVDESVEAIAAEGPPDPDERPAIIEDAVAATPSEVPQPALTKFRKASVQPPQPPSAQDPSQSARLAQIALASESLGSEVSDGTDFLTQVLSSF